jgi:ATP-dependent DNA helicase RecQ
VPSFILGGTTLVVTPLVSLMEDQVHRARSVGLKAGHLSSTQTQDDRARTMRRLGSGGLDVLFVSPERLDLPAFREIIDALDITLVAVDEAHCISEWGHDFRPAYRKIGRLVKAISCPTLALTASATPEVRADIIDNLQLSDVWTEVRSFDRPNLSWVVLAGGSLAERAQRSYRILRDRPGCAIVYAPTRRSVELVRNRLASCGIRATPYHAGLRPEERSRVQSDFMNGHSRVVVATNAFGMGIDKADVRTVLHIQLPGTLESYYQEAGRAGRDGELSLCVAFHGRGDRRLVRRFIDRSHPSRRTLRRLHRTLRRLAGHDGIALVDHPEVMTVLGSAPDAWMAGEPEGPLAALERVGAIRRIPHVAPGSSRLECTSGTLASGPGSVTRRVGVLKRADLAAAARQRRRVRAKLDAVESFARSRGCRCAVLLRYFGEDAPERCGRCDRCGTNADEGLDGQISDR